MSDKILKDGSDRIWVDSNNNIIKNRSFTETTITNGKIAEFIAGDYEDIGGFCRTWYDSVGAYDLVQTTASYQFKIVNYNGINVLKALDSGSVYNYQANFISPIIPFCSMIVVVHHTNSTGFKEFLKYGNYNTFASNGATLVSTADKYLNISGNQHFLANSLNLNGASYTSGTSVGNGDKILYADWNATNDVNQTLFSAGGLDTRNYKDEIIHLTFYNRKLNNNELIYNANALATKYNITL